MKRIITLLLIVWITCMTTVRAQEVSSEYRSAVLELLKVSNFDQNIDAMADIMSQSLSAVPQVQELIPDLMKVIREAMPELAVKSYAKYIPLDDVNAVLAFKKSPLGQKDAALGATIAQESANYGRMMVKNAKEFDALPLPSSAYVDAVNRYADAINFEATTAKMFSSMPGSEQLDQIMTKDRMRKVLAITMNKYYTLEEINALTEFSNTPSARKLNSYSSKIYDDLQAGLQPIVMTWLQERFKY